MRHSYTWHKVTFKDCLMRNKFTIEYVSIQPLHHGQDMTQGQFFKQFEFSFPSWLVSKESILPYYWSIAGKWGWTDGFILFPRALAQNIYLHFQWLLSKTQNKFCPVGWGRRIHRLDMTLNNLMVRFQQCWSFGECGVPLHCHCS